MTADAVLLCAANALAPGASHAFSVTIGGRTLDLFVVRSRDGHLVAYEDACPHTGAPLAWREHDYLDYAGQHIQCGIHGALFRIRDGLCLHGPCLHQSLRALSMEERNGDLWLIQTTE